jgi:hypothetical protein
VKSLRSILTPERALIFRITHRANVPWSLKNGLHCASSLTQDPHFVSIGKPDLIERRRSRRVPVPPGGTLDDYIPFYFTPCSPMLYNILTGHGVRRRAREEIVVLVSSFDQLDQHGLPYVFTDRHAYLRAASFFRDRSDLRHIDYDLLKSKAFKRDREAPAKFDSYQAEALVHGKMPSVALLGLACYTEKARSEINAVISDLGLELKTVVRRNWYFP